MFCDTSTGRIDRMRSMIFGVVTWCSLASLLGAGFSGCGPTTSPRVDSNQQTPAVTGEVAAVQSPAIRPVSRPASDKADWRFFRGPERMGVSQAADLPVQWNSQENLAWKVELPGPGASSPIVYDDQIYLTCYSGYLVPGQDQGSLDHLVRHVIALRRDDGSVIWNKTIKATLPEEEQIRDHGYAANTPAADSDQVYAFLGKTGVFAFDHQGNERWRADVGDRTNGWGTAASPLLYEDLVIINASVESESLIALDRSTGQQRWRVDGIRESWNTPLIVQSTSGRSELVVAKQGDVLAFDPRTGDQYWSCKTDIGWYMVPSVVADDGVIYCLGGRSGNAALAIRAGGQGDVTATHRLWTSTKGSNVSSPVLFNGHLYWMHEQRGTAYCADAKTGDVVYENRLDRADQVYASALLADGKVYYVARNGKTYVLAASPQFELLAVNDLSDKSTFDASPAVDGSRLLVRSNRFLYCIGK